MGDIKTLIQRTVRELIRVEYPHARRSGSVVARIQSCEEAESGLYRYRIKLLTREGNEDDLTPEIPGILSEVVYAVGDKVVVHEVNGQYQYISGRWYT